MKIRIPLERGAKIKIGSFEMESSYGFLEFKTIDEDRENANRIESSLKQEESLIYHLQESNLERTIYPPLSALTLPPDAQKRLANLKQQNNFVMSGVRSQLGSGEGNRIKRAKNKGNIDEHSHSLYMSQVELEVCKFRLFQAGWEELSKYFSKKDKSPKSEVELYMWYLKDVWNFNYSMCFKKFYCSVTATENRNRTLQKTILEKFNNRDEIKIEDYGEINEGWLKESLKILKTFTNKDRFIRKALKDFDLAVANYAGVAASLCALQRKGKKYFLLDGCWSEGVYTPRKNQTRPNESDLKIVEDEFDRSVLNLAEDIIETSKNLELKSDGAKITSFSIGSP